MPSFSIAPVKAEAAHDDAVEPTRLALSTKMRSAATADVVSPRRRTGPCHHGVNLDVGYFARNRRISSLM